MSAHPGNYCPDHFGCAAGGFRKNDACPKCGIKVTDKCLNELWAEHPPRFLIVGKPCTGKTALAKQISAHWKCVLVNGTELIRYHCLKDDAYGKKIKQLMLDGKDVNDELVIDILQERLDSDECRENGYVIDDFPTYSQKSLSVSRQLKFLDELDIFPDYVVHLDVMDEILLVRWDSIRVDMETGIRFTLPPNSNDILSVVTDPDYENIHPKFDQLILDHEEIYENMDANIRFYNTVVEPEVRSWLADHHSEKIIPMDGNAPAPAVFQMLQMKLHMITHNPDASFEELFGDLKQSAQPGECCHRCGCRFATPQPAPDIWAEEPPRIVIFGKPCTGKTTLARRLCAQWNCQLVNATDLIINHLKTNSTLGKKIRATMNEGKDLTDQFVFCILREKLLSPGCTESGYVLDGVPTHSEKSHSIANQIEFLDSLDPPPNYVIHIRIPDEILRSRWGAVRIDVNDGTLYRKCSHDCTVTHLVRHPDFPELDDSTRNRLITRHEEIAENLDNHFQFYHSHMSPAINDYLKRHDSSKTISLDGTKSSLTMLHTLLYELSILQRHPGTATSELFSDFTTSTPPPPIICPCLKHELHHYEPLADPWVERPPRILIVGKPCTGKTTLAKRLCATWGCILVNASEIISAELSRGCELGEIIREKLISGSDLDDHLVLELFRRTLRQRVCQERGYILEGIPNHSELTLTVPQQIDFLKSLPDGPEYVIHLQMTDNQLRERWEDMRIDIEDGTLYSKYNYADKKSAVGRWTRHPDFPIVDDATKERLITRHEELQENLDKHFIFYHRVMEEQLAWFMSSLDPSTVLSVDADLSPSELLQDIMLRFSVMARHPGVPTATLFEIESDESGDTVSSCQCQCGEKRAPKDDIHISGDFWRDRVPRIMVVGNSCCGKTTLAKKMCKDWGCVLINASELIQSNLAEQTPLGKQMEDVMKGGEDLNDTIVLNMLQKKLESPECTEKGFVIDDIPTSSEKGLPISYQMEMLNALKVKPDFVIDIQIPRKELLKRWEAVRIDLADGALYGGERALRLKPGTHPTFPAANAKMRQRLITRHEELVDNVEKQDVFYNDYVRPQIEEYVLKLGQNAVISVDGTLSRSELYKSAYIGMRETLGT